MDVTITLSTGNAALQDEGAISKAISVAAEFAEAAVLEMEAAALDGRPMKFASAVTEKVDGGIVGKVCDVNGNTVGKWMVWNSDAASPEMKAARANVQEAMRASIEWHRKMGLPHPAFKEKA